MQRHMCSIKLEIMRLEQVCVLLRAEIRDKLETVYFFIDATSEHDEKRALRPR